MAPRPPPTTGAVWRSILAGSLDLIFECIRQFIALPRLLVLLLLVSILLAGVVLQTVAAKKCAVCSSDLSTVSANGTVESNESMRDSHVRENVSISTIRPVAVAKRRLVDAVSYGSIYEVFDGDRFADLTRPIEGERSSKSAKMQDYDDFRKAYQLNNNTVYAFVNAEGRVDPYKLDYVKVTVSLSDIEDNWLTFDESTITVSVSEDLVIGRDIATFRAVDTGGGESVVTYEIDRSSDRKRQFNISSEGVVKLQRALDREETARHELTILAMDDGIPRRTGTAQLTIVVNDVNDNPPRFRFDYTPIIIEGTPLPSRVVEIAASDDDDWSQNNGPPFTFRMHPNASDDLRQLFEIEHNPDGDNGNGVALLTAKKVFDREEQKEYMIPIVIKDSGHPSQTGTSTLTVVIGDVNDNLMQHGSKRVLVYSLNGETPPTKIGRVHVEDPDDWDLSDKTFFWENNRKDENFELDMDSGYITMAKLSAGVHELNFLVYDRTHKQEATASVTVEVRDLPEEAIHNSGSIRFAGITDEDFIRVWDWKTQTAITSKMDQLREIIADLTETQPEDVAVLSVILKQQSRPPITDVRFAVHASSYHKPSMLNGLVALNRQLIEGSLGVHIAQIGIDECLYGNLNCDSSCNSELVVDPDHPVVVNANRTAFVGVNALVRPVCECLPLGASSWNQHKQRTCASKPYPCYNGGSCFDTPSGYRCRCPRRLRGPQCQETTRSFSGGDGFIWLSPLVQCEASHLSFEFVTTTPNGLILYNGPLTRPDPADQLVEDFINVELVEGRPRLLLDYGSGPVEITVAAAAGSLTDGRWHRVDVYWNRQSARITVDRCMQPQTDRAGDWVHCENVTTFDSSNARFDEFLNVNSPLQVGGAYVATDLLDAVDWAYKPNMMLGFDGCIRNLVHNSEMYDLGSPGRSQGSEVGCPRADEVCAQAGYLDSCENGHCEASFREAACICDPGYHGLNCESETLPKTFQQSSYMRHGLAFQPHPFRTDIQLLFRTRQTNGELVRLTGHRGTSYVVLEIRDRRLRLRFNLDRYRSSGEIELWLPNVIVNDGHWHHVTASRFGGYASICLDGGGEGRRFSELLDLDSPHQRMSVDTDQVLVGGDVQYVGHGVTIVDNDLQDSCLNDVRIDGRYLASDGGAGELDDAATVLDFRNVIDGCPSNNPCAGVVCPAPFVCIDLWMMHTCACGTGFVFDEVAMSCILVDKCGDAEVCLNGGTCISRRTGNGFYCVCLEGFVGEFCETTLQRKILRLSAEALAIIIVCLLIMLVLFLILLVCWWSRRSQKKLAGSCKGGVRDNIVAYNDEGGGENDTNLFDISTIRVPTLPVAFVVDPPPKSKRNVRVTRKRRALPKKRRRSLKEKLLAWFCCRKRKEPRLAELYTPSPPPDDVRTYAYEGMGSSAGSLSLASDEATNGVQKKAEGEQRSRPFIVDEDQVYDWPFDDVRVYAHEGAGSSVGSLSSLNSVGVEDEDQQFDHVNEWGPKFQKLADIYAPADESIARLPERSSAQVLRTCTGITPLLEAHDGKGPMNYAVDNSTLF